MGNIAPSQTIKVNSQHLEDLIKLTSLNYNSSYRLSFNPFNFGSQALSVPFEQHIQKAQSDFSISEEVSEEKNMSPLFEEEPQSIISAQPIEFEDIKEDHLQKNQILHQKNVKDKQIRKKKKVRKIRAEPQLESQAPQICEEAQLTTAPDQGIRDQNNCKSYHKLVKNYLQEKNLSQKILMFENKYHTRYYFIVALILIKHYVDQNFTQKYARIVREELEAQQKKIQRKLAQKEKIQKRMKQLQALKGNNEELLMKKQKLEKQIQHIEVVKYEISQFSMRSCATFFQGDLEASLKILYLKDDPIMRKKYYFDSALKIVQEIQDQVRKATSRKS